MSERRIHDLLWQFRTFLNLGENELPTDGDFYRIAEFADKHPEIKIILCDDALHTLSCIVCIPHQDEVGWHGLTVYFVPQIAQTPSEVFFYRGHMDSLYASLGYYKNMADGKSTQNSFTFDTVIDCHAAEEDPDYVGEWLRQRFFTDDKKGCYTNFDVNQDVSEIAFADDHVLTKSSLPWKIYKLVLGSTPIIMRYYWDGDGYLSFQVGNWVISNDDCKKDYHWQVQTLKGFINEYEEIE